MHGEVRTPLVEGIFFPSEADRLKELFPPHPPSPPLPLEAPLRAAVVPHAAYPFILPFLSEGFRAVGSVPFRVSRVIALAALHRERREGIFLPPHRAFACASGSAALETELIEEITAQVRGAEVTALPFEEEHALDVLLPPISLYFPAASLLPVLMGGREAVSIQALVRTLALAETPETVVIVSSNLSAETASPNLPGRIEAFHEALTGRTGSAVAERLLQGLNEGRITACGAPILAALAQLHGDLTAHPLRTGSSISGEESTGVGYGAYAISYSISHKEAEDEP
jgi:hypothetical protein